ncbi:MAG: flavodoxin FldA [Succinivibrionaceae bacterium]|nr:flavodoxin FldA [Succinivibrionaceae bacterium]
MAVVGLFFGSDTGNTEKVAKQIQATLGSDLVDLHDIAKAKAEDFAQYDFLILGTPTWYTGELQSDWDAFMPEFQKVDLNDKVVALFGLGDQEDYCDYFLDGMGILKEQVLAKGAVLVGNWSTEGYSFGSEKALIDENHFAGLAIDEDRQYEQTEDRIKKWCAQLTEEMSLNLFK